MKNAASKLLATAAVSLCLSALSQAAATAQTDDVDPINDSAGVLVPSSSSGSTGTLYTTSNEESGVLASLQATPIGTNQYRTAITGSPIDFVVSRVIFPGYFLPPGDLICKNPWANVVRGICVTTISPGSSGCFPYTNGNYARLSYNATRKCKRLPTSLCVQVNRIAWTRTIYFDSQCTTPIRVDTGTDLMCN